MNRDEACQQAGDRTEPWDVIIIGGGATGLGAGVDAAARGHSTLVLEQSDFAKGTSSRSTKLIHGGVRYLAEGRVGLVRRALKERHLLLQNAPHLVHDLAFAIPAYARWEIPYYFAGLKLYDLLAGEFRRGSSRCLSRNDLLERAPTVAEQGLRGGVLYHDCQFDDARLAVSLAQTIFDQGGTALNYVRVAGLIKRDEKVCGVKAVDVESGRESEIHARVVVNATGVFSDQILRMDHTARAPLIAPSQGIHIVLERAALPGNCALLVPRTDDGRVLFAIPWHGKVLLGTTDTPVETPELEPRPLDAEFEFLLRHAGRYLSAAPGRSDILSVFTGLRPLVARKPVHRTASVSRDHHIEVSASGLVTIAGGKWTTYRHMAEQVIDEAQKVAALPRQASQTHDLPLHGWRLEGNHDSLLSVYGADAEAIGRLADTDPSLAGTLHPRLPFLKAQVVWGARHEMARTVEDILARRMRALFLDARASIEAAPVVAGLMAAELGRDSAWEQSQVAAFGDLAAGYLPRE
jgi:glycerol-3-phosphate dehydrogenase